MKKNAISPLIATVLIIGFTVSLTAVVMTWGKGFIKEKTEKEGALAEARISCVNIGFTVDKSCKEANPKNLDFTIRNTKDTKIDGFTFRSTELAATNEIKQPVDAFATRDITITVASSISTIDIVPLVKTGNSYLPCNAQAKTVRISQCTS